MVLSFHVLKLSDSGLSLKILLIKYAALAIVLAVSSHLKKEAFMKYVNPNIQLALLTSQSRNKD